MHRWRMCWHCGVKLQPYGGDDDIVIEQCPICKGLYLTVLSSELLKKLKTIDEDPRRALLKLLEEAACRMRVES